MAMAQDGGPWTHEKLSILRSYLDAYTTALKNQPFRLTYVDAFAGSGFWSPSSRCDMDEPTDFRQMWKGSASLALDIGDEPFDRLVFIEQDEERYKTLERLAGDHPDRNIEIFSEDSNGALPRLCTTLPHDDRAVVFLDPFATQVSWCTCLRLQLPRRSTAGSSSRSEQSSV